MAQSAPTGPRRGDAAGRSPGDVRFDLGSQSAGNISNVGRDQYNAYIAYVQQQRESFLRDVAATRTKARWLVWLGLFAMLAGVGIMLWLFEAYFTAFGDVFGGNVGPEAINDVFQAGFGQEIAGINAMILAVGLATLGQIVLIVGVVLHIVATARRKRADREFAVPAPWGFQG